MAMVVLTGLHLFTLERVAGRNIEPAGNCFHQLIAGDGEAIHIAAAGDAAAVRLEGELGDCR
jgi:hypothetical protein